MRFAWIVSACLVSGACGGDGGTDPAGHTLTGAWTYGFTQLSDGSSTNCHMSRASEVTITQRGVGFDGSITGGLAACTTAGVQWTAGFGQGRITAGKIIGDSVTFDIDGGQWRSWGRFVTDDSMAGFLNANYPTPSGSNLIMTGYWYSTRR